MLMYGRVGGGIMIFQGAPGAGKTALMLECMEAVRQHSTPDNPWVAVPIEATVLDSVTDVIKIMMLETNLEIERLSKVFQSQEPSIIENLKKSGEKIVTALENFNVTVNLGVVGVTRQSKSSNFETSQDIRAETAFRDAASSFENFNLIIFVDEAQNTPVSNLSKSVINCLHHGIKGISLIAAFFGLSDTKQVLRQCGLSRLPDERVVTLDVLPHDDAKDAIRAVFDAYDFKDPDQAIWVDKFASLSQGWPQHINRVSVAAGRVMHRNGSGIQPNLLQSAIAMGQERKNDYYASRLEACSEDPWIYKQLAEAVEEESDGVLARFEIDKLTETFRKKDQSIDDFLTDALHAGVLMELSKLPKHYKIPIPSFGEYLRDLPHRVPPDMNGL